MEGGRGRDVGGLEGVRDVGGKGRVGRRKGRDVGGRGSWREEGGGMWREGGGGVEGGMRGDGWSACIYYGMQYVVPNKALAWYTH